MTWRSHEIASASSRNDKMKKLFFLLSLLCLLSSLSFLCFLSPNTYAGTITKTNYEEFYRYHDFADWLDGTETISSCEVKIYERDTGTDVSSTLVSNVICQTPKVIYKLKGGTAGKLYTIKIKITSSTGQKFEDWMELKVL